MNSSLKDYYVKIEKLYNDSVRLLVALNKSLSTNSSEVSVQITNADSTQSTLKIPSFLYLESKIEQLSTNFDILFNMPKSGEAWFHNANDMYKLKVVQANIAPLTPEIDDSKIISGIKQSTFLKDIVSPQTFLKLNISNIPDNIHKLYMKKYTFSDINIYESLVNGEYNTYDDYVAALYNLVKGVDYDVYNSIIDMPIRKNDLDSKFEIIEIIDILNEDDLSINTVYNVRFNTILYHNTDDKTVTYNLQIGDFLSLNNQFNIFKVTNIKLSDDGTYVVQLEETNGNVFLQTTIENSNMLLHIYNPEYTKYHYVEVPIEENQYVTVFLATIDNNIRSSYSAPLNIDLSKVDVYDENGQPIINTKTNTPYSYLTYYNQYCKNIGDILEGLTNSIYPQFSNFTPIQLRDLQESEVIKSFVTNALNNTDLKVVRINDHIFNESTSKQITTLNAQKLQLNSQLTAVQNNIDDVYNQLTTTNFNENVSVTQNSLKEQLNIYYQERLTLNKQLISVINEINVLKGSVKSLSSSKYRIRGILNTTDIETYIEENINLNAKIIGIDVEYRYKSINSDTSNVISVNANIFPEWNKFNTIDKERKLVFDNTTNNYNIEYVSYDSTNNIINWKQVDIPITSGEDVIIRLRYKYCIGQPFMDFYSPWSEEFTMSFPIEFTDENDLSSILESNDTDVVNAKFIDTLISGGYEEHVNNKIIDGSQQYYHMPENIYSGFNTPENKLISLKDKLLTLSNDIDLLKVSYNQYNQQYKTFIEYDGNTVELYTNINNEITVNIYGNYNVSTFSRKVINLIFKNTGDIPVKFYTLFSGLNSTFVAETKNKSITKNGPYKDVPISIEGKDDIKDIKRQTCNQWIYFRNNNPYTGTRFYVRNNEHQLSYILNSQQGMLHPIFNGASESNPNATYTTTISNSCLFKYENIDLTNYSVESYGAFLQMNSAYEGAFFIPNILSESQILCDINTNGQVYKSIAVGDTISVPLLLEYYIKDNYNTFKTTKRLCFDIRPNVDGEIQHYMITINVINNIIEQQSVLNNTTTSSDTVV